MPRRGLSIPTARGLALNFVSSCQVFDGGPVGLGTMMVLHAADGAEGSQPILPGVNAGGFYALLNMARQVLRNAGMAKRYSFSRGGPVAPG